MNFTNILKSAHLEIARRSKRSLLMRRILFRFRNYVTEKEIITKIRYGNGEEAIFKLDLSSYIGKRIFYEMYEPEVTKFYRKLLKDKKTVWDIGSNIGYYAVMAGILLKNKGTVYAFEPVRVNFSYLEDNASLNGLGNLKLFNVALSNKDGEAVCHLLSRNKTTSSPTLNSEWALHSGLFDNTAVITRNPMSLLSRGEIERPDIIKIDIEAHEDVVLGEMEQLLTGENAPEIILEIMPPTIDALNGFLIEKCNYRCYHILPDGLIEVKRLEMKRPYNDYFFTKNDVKI
jgi:FkbM family methyltransferase